MGMRGPLRGGVAVILVVALLLVPSACGPNQLQQGDARKKLGMSEQEILVQELKDSADALAASGGRGAQALPNTTYLNSVDPNRCDRYVDPAGSDSNAGTSSAPWKTIAKAFNTLSAGQIACVRPGTYNNDRATTARSGSASAPIVVRAADPANRPLLMQGMVIVNHAYWVIDGLRININRQPTLGVNLTSASSFSTLRNSEIYNSGGGTAVAIQGKDIFLYKNVTHDNIKPGDDSHGYDVMSPGARILLKDNIAYNNSGDGFQCEHYDPNLALRPYDITIEGGSMWNDPSMYNQRTEQAFDIKQCLRVTIRGMTIKQYRSQAGTGNCGTSGVVHVGAENVLVEKNHFSDLETAVNMGHDTYGVNQVTFRYNIVKGVIRSADGKCGNGINFGKGTNLEAYNNTFDGVVGYAITVGTDNWPATAGGTKNADVFNNIIVNSTGSIRSSTYTAPDMESDYNLFYNSPKPSNGQERNSLVANPNFLSDGSYRTASGSPARDSAYAINIPACSTGQLQGCYCGIRGDRGAIESDCSGGVVLPPPSPTPTVTATPTATATATPTSTPTSGTTIPVSRISGSAGTMVGGEAALAIDGNMTSYWACSGTTGGCYLTIDLGSLKGVGGMDIAWHQGDQRVESFAISVSADGSSYSQVYSGKSSGLTLNFERSAFLARSARYVRLTGYGNTLNAWNSVKELRVLAGAVSGTPSPTVTVSPIPAPSRSPSPAPTPTPTVTSTSNPTPTATSVVTTSVFSDALGGGWMDWSWATHSLGVSSPVASGARSISVNYGAWTGLYLAHNGFNTAGYSSLDVMVHGGSTGNQRVNVAVQFGGGSQGPAVALASYCAGGRIPANQWALCQVPLSALGAANRSIAGITFQDASGATQPVMYFDQIFLRGASSGTATPSPTPTQTPTPTPTSTGSTGKWVSGYYISYLPYPSSSIDFNSLTHLMVGRVKPNTDGSLDMSFDGRGTAFAQDAAQKANAAGRKAILMIGGAESTPTEWNGATSSTNLSKFVNNLVTFAKQYGFVGFDIDWEQGVTVAGIQRLAIALRNAMPGAVITTAVGYINPNFQVADPAFAGLAQYVDQINIMTYDMAGAYSGWNSWHNSALFGAGGSTPTSVKASVDAFLKAGVPAGKLGMGIGFYGVCYSSPVTAPRQPLNGATIPASDNVMSYANIINQYLPVMTRNYDAVAEVPYLSSSTPKGPAGCTYVSYEDERSIAAKGAYAKQVGLGGTIIWAINEGYNPGAADPNALLKAVGNAFLR